MCLELALPVQAADILIDEETEAEACAALASLLEAEYDYVLGTPHRKPCTAEKVCSSSWMAHMRWRIFDIKQLNRWLCHQSAETSCAAIALNRATRYAYQRYVSFGRGGRGGFTDCVG